MSGRKEHDASDDWEHRGGPGDPIASLEGLFDDQPDDDVFDSPPHEPGFDQEPRSPGGDNSPPKGWGGRNVRHNKTFVDELGEFASRHDPTNPLVKSVANIVETYGAEYRYRREEIFSLLNRYHDVNNSYQGKRELTLDFIKPQIVEYNQLNMNILEAINKLIAENASPLAGELTDIRDRLGRKESDFFIVGDNFGFFPTDISDYGRKDILRDNAAKYGEVWDWRTGIEDDQPGIGPAPADKPWNGDVRSAEARDDGAGAGTGPGGTSFKDMHSGEAPIYAASPGELDHEMSSENTHMSENVETGGDAAAPNDELGAGPTAGQANRPALDKELIDKPDPLGEFMPIGYAPYDMLISALWEARGDKRREIAEKLRVLAQERERLLREISERDVNEKIRISNGGGSGGGGGALSGLLSGIGSAGSAIARKIIGDSGELGKVADIERKMSGLVTFRDIALDRQYPRLLRSAGMSIMTHQTMASGVNALNEALVSDAEGAEFLQKFGKTAEDAGQTREQLWDRIHDFSDKDASVTELREMASALCQKPEFANNMERIKAASEGFDVNSQKFADYMGMMKRAGVEMNGINDAMVNSLSSLECPDSLLSKPGDTRLDKIKKKFEEMLKTFLAALANIAAALHIRPALGR
jgi:hypothetical protein